MITSTSAADNAKLLGRNHRAPRSAMIKQFFQRFMRAHEGRTIIFTSDKTSAPCHYRMDDDFLHMEPMFDHGVNIALAFDSEAFGVAAEIHADLSRRLARFAIFQIGRRSRAQCRGLKNNAWDFGVMDGCAECRKWQPLYSHWQAVRIADMCLLGASLGNHTVTGFRFINMKDGQIPWDMKEPADFESQNSRYRKRWLEN